MRVRLAALLLTAACNGPAATDPMQTPPGKSDAPPPTQAPVPVGLRLLPEGRFALATGEPLALTVQALDAAGAATDVTAAATFDVRDEGAGSMSGARFVAGADGSRATSIVARYGGLVSNPILISTLTPIVTASFAAATVDGASAAAQDGSLVIQLDAVAGQQIRVTLPLDRAVALTNVERALVGYRLSGEAQLALALGSQNGDEAIEAVGPDTVTLAPGADANASLPLAPAGFDKSWDARTLVVDLTVTSGGKATLVLDDVRLLRQFIVGANLAWLDGAYQHDFGRSFHHPSWGVTYTSEHTEAVLRFCQDHGIRLLRVWVFESCEGLVKDANEIVTGLDPTLLANFDDLVFNQLPRYDVKVELMLIAAAHHAGECSSPSPIPVGPARTAFLTNAVVPFVSRYAASPWVWGVDLMNEPEAAVGGPTGNWVLGTDWDTMRSFLAEAARAVRTAAPRLYVSSGSGWHESQNVAAGRFSGLGFTHLDYHSYTDGADVPDYPELLRHARVLLGEVGQSSNATDDAQQSSTLASYLEAADSFNYWGVLAWAVDHPGSTDRLSLLAKDSTYADMRGRPAADILVDFTTGRGDIGP
jgi:hypothetical protein